MPEQPGMSMNITEYHSPSEFVWRIWEWQDWYDLDQVGGRLQQKSISLLSSMDYFIDFQSIFSPPVVVEKLWKATQWCFSAFIQTTFTAIDSHQLQRCSRDVSFSVALLVNVFCLNCFQFVYVVVFRDLFVWLFVCFLLCFFVCLWCLRILFNSPKWLRLNCTKI